MNTDKFVPHQTRKRYITYYFLLITHYLNIPASPQVWVVHLAASKICWAVKFNWGKVGDEFPAGVAAGIAAFP
jgi:hypothetical protein